MQNELRAPRDGVDHAGGGRAPARPSRSATSCWSSSDAARTGRRGGERSRPRRAGARPSGRRPSARRRSGVTAFETSSGIEVRDLYTAGRHRRARRGPRPGPARRVPVHPRRPADDVPQPLLDDAPVRGLRHGRGDQPALPLPPGAGPDRACRSPSTCRPRWATTPTPRPPRARSAGSASRSPAWPTWPCCSTACRWATSRRR